MYLLCTFNYKKIQICLLFLSITQIGITIWIFSCKFTSSWPSSLTGLNQWTFMVVLNNWSARLQLKPGGPGPSWSADTQPFFTIFFLAPLQGCQLDVKHTGLLCVAVSSCVSLSRSPGSHPSISMGNSYLRG